MIDKAKRRLEEPSDCENRCQEPMAKTPRIEEGSSTNQEDQQVRTVESEFATLKSLIPDIADNQTVEQVRFLSHIITDSLEIIK